MPTLNDQGDNEALKKKLKASIAAKRNKDNKETSNGHQVRHWLGFSWRPRIYFLVVLFLFVAYEVWITAHLFSKCFLFY